MSDQLDFYDKPLIEQIKDKLQKRKSFINFGGLCQTTTGMNAFHSKITIVHFKQIHGEAH